MGNLSHTVGGTDNLVSFKSAARVPIDSLKVHFSPIQEGEGDPSPENVRPIRGWNEVEAYRSGKNIARVTGYNAINSSNADDHTNASNKYGTTISTNNYSLPDTSVVITQTQATSETASDFRNGYFAVMVKNLIYGNYYDVSFKITDVTNNILNCNLNNIYVLVPNGSAYPVSEIKDNVFIYKNIQWKRNNSIPNRSNFEIRNCGMSFTLSEFMVTPAGMNDGVFEPYCGEVIPVTFPTEVGTIYGGYVDLAKGEVVAEYGHYTFSGSEKDSFTYYNTSSTLNNVERHCFRTKILDRLLVNNSSSLAYANIAVPISTKSGDFLFYIGTSTNQILFYINSSMCEPTIESFNAWLSEHPVQLVYKLKDPIRYPLTPTQLQTFLNDNAFWSNTNDVTEVSYAIHDTAPIRAARKRIMAASPRLETASDSLINFSTDVAAPLKECKVYFEPIQEGEGDPSPENIRPIIGWTSVDIYKSGKNLIRLPVMTRTTRGITWTVNEDGSIQVDGTASSNTWMSNWSDDSQHVDFYLRAGTYALSRNGTPAVKTIYLIARDGSTTKDIGQVTSEMMNGVTFTLNQDTLVGFQAAVTPNQGEIHTIIHPQLELLSSTDYEAPNNSMIPITFPAEAGTIYGGYVDLVKGEIVEEYVLFEKTWGELTFRGTLSNTDYKNMDLDKDIYESSKHSYVSKLSNIVPYSYSWIENDSPHFYVSNSRRIYVWLPIGTEASTTIQIIGHLKEPIHYPIDPQTLKTLRGTNNIWSTSNGPITIKYWKH